MNLESKFLNSFIQIDEFDIKTNMDEVVRVLYNKLKDKCFMGKFEYNNLDDYVDETINHNWNNIKFIQIEQEEIAKHAFKPDLIY